MEEGMKERFDRLESLIVKTVEGQAGLVEGQASLAQGQASLAQGQANLLQGHANLERLIVDVKESLETEMQSGFSSLNTKLDDMSIRVDRHSGLLRSGGQRIARLDDWAEKVDKSLEAKDREIADLRERVVKLEMKKSA